MLALLAAAAISAPMELRGAKAGKVLATFGTNDRT